ncbi:MAG: hypothetical protein GY801_09120 [bacterium]|nr:hypothetical protein [bacterium]
MKALTYVTVIVCSFLLLPSTTFSHHQLGLPHYLYSEEYPQIPTMVIDADVEEGYSVTFSIYPGKPMPGDVVRMKVYIKNKETDAVYTKAIEISVSTEMFLRGEKEILEPKTILSEYNEYKMSYQFDAAEKYLVNVTFEAKEGVFEKIPFPIVIGETRFNMIPVILGGIFLVIFIAVGVTRKKKDKTHPGKAHDENDSQ